MALYSERPKPQEFNVKCDLKRHYLLPFISWHLHCNRWAKTLKFSFRRLLQMRPRNAAFACHPYCTIEGAMGKEEVEFKCKSSSPLNVSISKYWLGYGKDWLCLVKFRHKNHRVSFRTRLVLLEFKREVLWKVHCATSSSLFIPPPTQVMQSFCPAPRLQWTDGIETQWASGPEARGCSPNFINPHHFYGLHRGSDLNLG